MPDAFEEKYLDVLQNIEAAIVIVYRQEPSLTDYEVEKVLTVLILAYQRNQTSRPRQLNPLAEQVYALVWQMCEWRLGREEFVSTEGAVIGIIGNPSTSLTPAEIVLCLKRIRKSVQFWSKEGGRQGYLSYVNHFIY